MSTLPADVARVTQLKKEVTHHEKRVKSAGLRAIRAIFFLALLFILGSFFFNVILENESFNSWINDFKWDNLLFNVLFGALIYYFILVQKDYHRLINKKRELHNLLLQNPLLAK